VISYIRTFSYFVAILAQPLLNINKACIIEIDGPPWRAFISAAKYLDVLSSGMKPPETKFLRSKVFI
jgi:hypothetical protein